MWRACLVILAVMVAAGCGAAPTGEPADEAPRTALEHMTNGYTHCLLFASGDVECWGKNKYGQVGDGTTEERLVPAVVMRDIKHIVMGQLDACALRRDDTIWCWGQLGFTDGVRWTAPQQLDALPGAQQLARSADALYALTRDGWLRCAGSCDGFAALPHDDRAAHLTRAASVPGATSIMAVRDSGAAYLSYEPDPLKLTCLGSRCGARGVAPLRGAVALDSFDRFYCAFFDKSVRCASTHFPGVERDAPDLEAAHDARIIDGMVFSTAYDAPRSRDEVGDAACILDERRALRCVRLGGGDDTLRRLAQLEPDERLFRRAGAPCMLRERDRRVRCRDINAAYWSDDARAWFMSVVFVFAYEVARSGVAETLRLWRREGIHGPALRWRAPQPEAE